jgi:hypothetical protein
VAAKAGKLMAETLNEFFDRTINGEEARREVTEKFETTFRDVIETMKKARSMILDLIDQRDKAEARVSSLLEIGPVATERERCANQVKKLLQGLGIDNIADEVSDRIRKGE